MDRNEITAEVAARLVAGQFPEWAGLPVVPVGLNGRDSTTFRLGGELSVRLPSGEDYVAQVSKEHRWLPVLAGQLPVADPRAGGPGAARSGVPLAVVGLSLDRGRARVPGARSQTWPPSLLTWRGS